MLLRFFLLVWFVFSFASPARGSRLRGPLPLDLQQTVLGPGCHLLTPVEASLPCSPAQLTAHPHRQFVANLYIGENFQRVNAYRKDVDNKDELAVVNKLLEEEKPLQLEAGSVLWMRNSFLSFAYVPLHMNFYTDVQNRSYPVVDMRFLLEKSIRIQASHQMIWKSWVFRGGLQARGAQRKTVFQNLALFDVLADPSLLKISEHESLYVEPALVIEHDSPWRPRASIFFQNLRVYHTGAESPSSINNGFFDTGIGVSPLTSQGWGHWDIGINYRFDKKLPENWERVQLLTAYSLGMMTTSGSISEGTWSLGVTTSFLSAKTGVSFTQTSYPEWNGSTRTDEIVNLEFGLVF